MINFCKGFFDERSMSNAITFGSSLVTPNNLDLEYYENRAATLLVSVEQAGATRHIG
jgi:hypothetical protein